MEINHWFLCFKYENKQCSQSRGHHVFFSFDMISCSVWPPHFQSAVLYCKSNCFLGKKCITESYKMSGTNSVRNTVELYGTCGGRLYGIYG